MWVLPAMGKSKSLTIQGPETKLFVINDYSNHFNHPKSSLCLVLGFVDIMMTGLIMDGYWYHARIMKINALI
jgi:hypothetical protein